METAQMSSNWLSGKARCDKDIQGKYLPIEERELYEVQHEWTSKT